MHVVQVVVDAHDPHLELHAVHVPLLRKYLSLHDVHDVNDVHY